MGHSIDPSARQSQLLGSIVFPSALISMSALALCTNAFAELWLLLFERGAEHLRRRR